VAAGFFYHFQARKFACMAGLLPQHQKTVFLSKKSIYCIKSRALLYGIYKTGTDATN
jgi:hypothetical protein